jgi:hypothetical protein
MEPTPQDWLAVGNDLRTVLNDLHTVIGEPLLPLPTEANRVPTEEELDAYNAVVPGMSETLKEMARAQMKHRQKLERQ